MPLKSLVLSVYGEPDTAPGTRESAGVNNSGGPLHGAHVLLWEPGSESVGRTKAGKGPPARHSAVGTPETDPQGEQSK